MTKHITEQDIYLEYSPKIRRYLNSHLTVEDSEDLLQDIFIKIYNSLPNFRGDSSLNTWIYRIATNSVIDRLKSNAHKFNKLQLEINPTTHQFNNIQFETTFEKQIEKEEMNDCIRQFINQLTDKNKTVFVLSMYENLTNKEISEILNISIDSVKIRLHRAKESLKTTLSKNCNIYFDECSEMCCEPRNSACS